VCQSDNRPSGLIFYFYVLALVSLGPLSAILNFTPCQPWPIVGPFEFAFTSHLPPSLAILLQPLSSPAVSTIYGPFPASATAIIIISDFKLKVAKYSTLSLRGDVRIYYSLCLLSFLLELISYLN
jgi:hypothetical protein